MIEVLEARHHPALAELTARCAVDVGRPDGIDWLDQHGGVDEHRWIRADGTAAIRLTLGRRTRNRHAAELELWAPGCEPAHDLLAEAVSLADTWTAVDRLELALPADHKAVATATELGFVPEVRRVARLPDGRDELVLGRLRPGVTFRPAGPPPPWPPRGPAPSGAWTYRPITAADAGAIRNLSVEPTSTWGTLQTPTSDEAYYTHRFHTTPPDHHLGLLVAGDEVLAIGGLHPTPVPDVRVLGMAVRHTHQGRGVGHALITILMEQAVALGARRVELSVWEDNHRARALYTKVGFVAEGVRRCDGVRAGGFASSLDMAWVPKEGDARSIARPLGGPP